MVLLVALVVLVPAVVLIRAHRGTDEVHIHRWAAGRGLALTAANGPMVRWYLRTARALRAWGTLAGLALSPVALAAAGVAPSPGATLLGAFAGYLVGALYAEVSSAHPVRGPRVVASLLARQPDDYAPRGLFVAQRAVAALIVAGGAAVLVAHGLAGGDRTDGWTAPPAVVALMALGAAVLVVLARLQRWLVERPRPGAEPSVLAALDAIRSQAVHSVASSRLAILLVLAGASALAASGPRGPVAEGFGTGFATVAGVAALVVCLHYGHRAWRVPRAMAESSTRPSGAPS